MFEANVRIVLDYLEGPTLNEHLKRRTHPFTVDQVVRLLAEMATALQEYHDLGLLYGVMTADDVLCAYGTQQ